MSCSRDAERCNRVAGAHGAPEAVAVWAAGRGAGGHCERCGGFLTTEGVCNNPRCGMLAMTVASVTPQEVRIRELWRSEFIPGIPIPLQNGDILQSGQRFTDSEYLATRGKVKSVAVVGQTLTAAVDGITDFKNPGETDTGTWVVELVDGTKAYYDPVQLATVCDKGCVGMCRHQMAALLVGEAVGSIPPDEGSVREQLFDTVIVPRQKTRGGMLTTPQVVRASDAAYAYLTQEFGETITTGVSELLPKSEEPAIPPVEAENTIPHLAKEKNPVAGPVPLTGTGNPAVNTLMHNLNVTPPVATARERLDKGDVSYRGNPIPQSDPRYELDEATKRVMTSVMRRTNLAWRAAARRVEARGGDSADPNQYAGNMEDRVWGLYGPPGTGKNSMGREIAASLGLGYLEVDVHNRTDFQSLLVDTIIRSDDKGGTSTEVALGAVGRALVEGNVVAINEIVAADPDAQTALHQVVQDGIIRAPGPEGATKFWKVHPNSMLFLTWNPNTTREDKPGAALLSRTPSYKMNYPAPADEARRLSKAMSDYFGERISPKQVKRAVNLVRSLRELYEQGELESPPTYRELQSFTKEWLLNGNDPVKAAELFRVLCTQGPDHEEQWTQVKTFAAGFQEGHWKL